MIAGGLAQHFTPGTAITAVAAISVAITVFSRPFVVRARAVRVETVDT
ncbi:hypothetical protein L1856_06255 [Streptomyces sp. Tue 6430]|nr:hypothetical protein [Streptomyces sp. Tue 6430]